MGKLTYIEKLATAVEEEGRDKSNWIPVGALFRDEETGRHVVKLNSLPVYGFKGWIRGFELEEKTEAPARAEPARRPAPPRQATNPDDLVDDIPF
jgi:hypothetical protein